MCCSRNPPFPKNTADDGGGGGVVVASVVVVAAATTVVVVAVVHVALRIYYSVYQWPRKNRVLFFWCVYICEIEDCRRRTVRIGFRDTFVCVQCSRHCSIMEGRVVNMLFNIKYCYR